MKYYTPQTTTYHCPHDQHQDGFIALTAVLILSAVFLVLVSNMTQHSLGSIVLTSEHDEGRKAARLADSCAAYALMQLTRMLQYSGDETLTIGDGICIVAPIVDTGGVGRTIDVLGSTTVHVRRARVEVESLLPQPQVATYQSF